MWCNITGEAPGEIWTWTHLGVKGLSWRCWKKQALTVSPEFPLAPSSPFAPRYPFRPVFPLAPEGPVSPFSPCSPRFPVGPCCPLLPWGPGEPCAPWEPCVPWNNFHKSQPNVLSISLTQGATKPLSACPEQVSSCVGQAGLLDNFPAGQVKLIPETRKCSHLVTLHYAISSLLEDDCLLSVTVKERRCTEKRNPGQVENLVFVAPWWLRRSFTILRRKSGLVGDGITHWNFRISL